MGTLVDPEIFKKLFVRTPSGASPAIRSFAKQISPQHEARFVRLKPEPDTKPIECYFNVKSKIERDGGELVFGWAIWEWPRVFIEAEHHAVWSDGSQLIDVTPNDPGIERVLFLPDPEKTFDEVLFNRRINIRVRARSRARSARLVK